MSIKRILGVLSLILLSAPVMPGLPATLASTGTQCTFECSAVGVTPIDGDCASKQTTCRCAGWWLIWRCAVR